MSCKLPFFGTPGKVKLLFTQKSSICKLRVSNKKLVHLVKPVKVTRREACTLKCKSVLL